MSKEKMIKIKGKEVSEETIAAALEAYHDFEEKKVTASIISFAISKQDETYGEEVAIIRLSDDMIEVITEGGVNALVIDQDGDYLTTSYDKFDVFDDYEDVDNVFGTLFKRTKKCRRH